MLSLFLAKGIIMLSLQDMNHEFIGRNDPHVESLRLKETYEQNLTPDELKKLMELAPMINQFMALDFKGRTGNFPEGQRDKPIEDVPLEEQMTHEEYGRMRGLDEDYIQEVMAGINGSKEVFNGDAPPVREPSNFQGDAPPMDAPPVKEAQPEERFFPSADPRQEFALGTEDLQQEQEQIQGMPPVQEVLPGAQSGLVEDPQDPNASPVGDTVPMDNVEEGTAVINAAAVRMVGLKDLMKQRNEAREILRSQGKIIDDEKDSSGEGVDIAVANGEFMFTKDEVGIIGEETINKWNKKGEAETEQAIAEEQPQQPQQVGMPPIMGAKDGLIVPPPQKKPYNMESMGALPAESPNTNMETYYTDNRTLTKGKDAGKEALFNLAKNMPLGMDRESWLATMAVHGEAGGDPASADAVANVIRNRNEVADNKGKGSELWQGGFEQQINNGEWNALGPKDSVYKDITIKGRNRREEFMNIDRESLYQRVHKTLTNPSREDPTEGRTFYIKRNRVNDDLAPLNLDGKGQQYFVKEFASGNLFDPKQIGDHVFYRYKH